MAKTVMIDQFHVSFLLMDSATQEAADLAAWSLDTQAFLNALRDGVRSILDANPALAMLSVTVER
jgi:hypothetical protein